MAALGTRKSAVEQDAWRGAHSRSTEEFLRDKALDRAWAELRRWQEEYPIDKVESYLTLLQGRYWAARNKWPQAIALAGDLVAINPDSPYADRLVFLAAECEEKNGRGDRACAAYQSLLTDYPGSPLVAEARKKLTMLTRKQAGREESRDGWEPVSSPMPERQRRGARENSWFRSVLFIAAAGIAVAAWSLVGAGDLIVDLGKAVDISMVGAVQRRDEEGKLRFPVDPKAKIAEPRVNARAVRQGSGKSIFRNLPPAAFECGAIVNPDHLRNQVEGCLIMGLGAALRSHPLREREDSQSSILALSRSPVRRHPSDRRCPARSQGIARGRRRRDPHRRHRPGHRQRHL